LYQRCGLAEIIAGVSLSRRLLVSLVEAWARISIFLGLALLIMQKALNFPMQGRTRLQDQSSSSSNLAAFWTAGHCVYFFPAEQGYF